MDYFRKMKKRYGPNVALALTQNAIQKNEISAWSFSPAEREEIMSDPSSCYLMLAIDTFSRLKLKGKVKPIDRERIRGLETSLDEWWLTSQALELAELIVQNPEVYYSLVSWIPDKTIPTKIRAWIIGLVHLVKN